MNASETTSWFLYQTVKRLVKNFLIDIRATCLGLIIESIYTYPGLIIFIDPLEYLEFKAA